MKIMYSDHRRNECKQLILKTDCKYPINCSLESQSKLLLQMKINLLPWPPKCDFIKHTVCDKVPTLSNRIFSATYRIINHKWWKSMRIRAELSHSIIWETKHTDNKHHKLKSSRIWQFQKSVYILTIEQEYPCCHDPLRFTHSSPIRINFVTRDNANFYGH